ncbi:MAG: type II toxin-antitoxin system RelE/ParE family toxin [Gemmatimonadales bacterium]
MCRSATGDRRRRLTSNACHPTLGGPVDSTVQEPGPEAAVRARRIPIHSGGPGPGRAGLSLLDQAEHPSDLDLPGYRLHALKGDWAGEWAVTVKAKWRIVFRMAGLDVVAVDLIDYH